MRAGRDGAAYGLVDVPGEGGQGVAQGRLGGPATVSSVSHTEVMSPRKVGRQGMHSS